MERCRCWFSPMRPVTPFMMMPTEWMVCSLMEVGSGFRFLGALRVGAGGQRRDIDAGATLATSSAHNVGRARALGCAVLLNQWYRIDRTRIWLATTDADSRVPRDWLTTQLAQHEVGVDHWYGRVSVADWSEYSGDARSRWQREYENESQPIHGANLGFNAAAYLAAGGFEPLDRSEEHTS